MTTAIVLLLVMIINYCLPKFSVVKDFLQTHGWCWVKVYLEFLLNFFNRIFMLRGQMSAVLVVLPLLIATFLLNNLFLLLLKGWGNILFTAVVLLYCLNSKVEDEHESMLVLAHERTFGIIFWFAMFGATGAMFYWFLTVSKTMTNMIVNDTADFQRGLNIMHGLAAWLPSRITGLIYALVGDFVAGFSCWYTCIKTPAISSSTVLLDCGQAALHTISKQDEKDLVARALVAWVILGMLIALIMQRLC